MRDVNYLQNLSRESVRGSTGEGALRSDSKENKKEIKDNIGAGYSWAPQSLCFEAGCILGVPDPARDSCPRNKSSRE